MQIIAQPHDSKLESCEVFAWCDGHSPLDFKTGGSEIHIGRAVHLELPGGARFVLTRTQESDDQSTLDVQLDVSGLEFQDVHAFAESLREVATYLDINRGTLLDVHS